MKKKSLFSKETIFTKRHVLKHCHCNQIILCLYENWYYNYVLNYYFKVRNHILKKLWLALNHRTSLTVEVMTMNFQLILLEKKKMVKTLNINIFHEKATGKGEKKIHRKHSDHLYSTSRNHSLYNAGPHCSFSAWHAPFLQEVYYCPNVLQKELFKGWELPCIHSGFVTLFFHGHRVTSTIWVLLNISFPSTYWKQSNSIGLVSS